MSKRRRVQLGVEVLENRLVPATIRFFSGNLFISNAAITAGTTTLTLRQTAPNAFTVQDGASTSGPFAGVSNINVTGTNVADRVTLDLLGRTYTGGFTANTGNGNDTTTIQSTGGTGAILGLVNVSGAAGNKTVNLNAGAGSTTSVLFGGTVIVSNPLGSDTATLGNSTAASTTTVGGDLIINGFSMVNLGAKTGAGTADPIVGGNVYVLDSRLSLPVTLNLADRFTANKDFVAVTGSGSASVTFNASTINGATQLVLGNPIDNVFLGLVAANTTTFGGTFSLTEGFGGGSGTGTNSVTFGGTVVANGDMQFNLGDAPLSFVVATLPTVGGNFGLTAGNGNDTIILGGTFNGNLTINLGNGTDNVEIVNPAAGTLSYTSGNGSDTVTLIDVVGVTWNVNMTFGNNDDTVNAFGVPGATLIGKIDGGGRITANTFNLIGFTLGPPFQLINFP